MLFVGILVFIFVLINFLKKIKMEQKQREGFEELFSRTIMAGERRYYLDVKMGERSIYLTLTESKRRFDSRSGKFFYERNRVRVFPEDIENLTKAFHEAEDFLKNFLKEHPNLEVSHSRTDHQNNNEEQ
jgi:hypothetical protein